MRYFLIIIAFLISIPLLAQEKKDDDLKVGLVLSGGGAKGLAHIGVLKVIEEAGIRIDYIGGTSMGAIVGGMYAAGYNASELDSIFSSVNFDNILQDNLPRSAKTFYERDDSERYAIQLPFDNFILSLPSSLSKGQNTYNLLAQNLDHVNNIQDFSKLPIPFFCVATDIEKGEQILLEKGYLADAISASGALPSLFSPVPLEGKLLIDGGVVNNYPIDELRAKGMDIIIGVDVQDTLRGRENLKSAPDVLLQINNFRSIKSMENKKNATDIYIRPGIDSYTVVDFDKGMEILALGKAAAMEKYDELKDIASRQAKETKQPIKKYAGASAIHIAPSPDSLYITAVSITGNKNYTRSFILGKLKFDPPVQTTYKELYSGINNLSATDNFERVSHRLQKVGEDTMLRLGVQEATSTQSIRLALHYDDLYRTAGLVNFTKKQLLFKNDVLSADIILGDNLRYNFNYYIDKGFYWSVGFKSTLTTFDQSISARLLEETRPIELPGINNLSLDFLDVTTKLFVQTLFVKQFSLDLGVQHKFLDVETETVVSTIEGETNFIFDRSHLAGAYAQLKYDSLDKKYFPTSGFYFDGDFDLFLYSSDFNNTFSEFGIGNSEFKYAFGISPKFTGVFEIAGGFKVGGSDDRSLDFFLGGFGAKKVNNLVPFLGYDFLGISGDGYVKTGFELDYELFPKNHLSIAANFANVGYGIFRSNDFVPPPAYTGYSIGYGVETFLGPLQARYSYSPERKAGEAFVTLGFQF